MARLTQTAASYTGTEPLTTQQAKDYLKVDHAEEDVLIDIFVSSARAMIEGMSGHIIAPATVVESWDDFPLGRTLPLSTQPPESITSIQYYDADNIQQTLSSSLYHEVLDKSDPRVRLIEGESWPTTYIRPDAVQVTIESGAVATIDKRLLNALYLSLHDMYYHRGDTETGPQPHIRNQIKRIISNVNNWYRKGRLLEGGI